MNIGVHRRSRRIGIGKKQIKPLILADMGLAVGFDGWGNLSVAKEAPRVCAQRQRAHSSAGAPYFAEIGARRRRMRGAQRTHSRSESECIARRARRISQK